MLGLQILWIVGTILAYVSVLLLDILAEEIHFYRG
jgi:hypothetical protein